MSFKIRVADGVSAYFTVLRHGKGAHVLVEPKGKGWSEPKVIVHGSGFMPMAQLRHMLDALELTAEVCDRLDDAIKEGTFTWPFKTSVREFTSMGEFEEAFEGKAEEKPKAKRKAA